MQQLRSSSVHDLPEAIRYDGPEPLRDVARASLPPLEFDNRFVRDLPGDAETGPRLRQVHGALYSRVDPTPVADPKLVAYSPEVAALVGFDEESVSSPAFAQVFGGNALIDGMEPYAANYGGHQFGH